MPAKIYFDSDIEPHKKSSTSLLSKKSIEYIRT